MSKDIACQTSMLERLIADLANFNETDRSELNSSRLRVMKMDLEDSYQSAKKLHNQLMSSKTSEAITSYISNKTFDSIRDTYFTFWSKIDELLHRSSGVEDSSAFLNQTTVNQDSSRFNFQLPKISIPKFAGNYREWKKFHNLFRTLVHENTNINNIQKLSYLQSFVEGEASDLIKHIELEEDNYGIAWSTLKERYDHNRMLVYTELKTLFNQPLIRSETASNLKSLLDTTRECLIALQNLGAPVETWDFVINYLIEEKLPRNTKQLWEQQVGKKTEIPSYSELKEFLNNRFRSLEMIELPDAKNTSKNFVNIKKPKYSLGSCFYCKGQHGIYKCKEFIQADIHEKQNIVKKCKLCSNCLSATHQIGACRVQSSCRVCRKRHHTLLHLYHTNTDPQQSIQPSHSSETTESRSFHINSKSGDMKLLGTAIINIINKDNVVIKARALIDPCSDDSYITTKMVISAGLKPYNSKSSVSGLGGVQTADCNQRVNFEICSINSNFSMSISAAVTHTIASQMPSSDINIRSLSYLRDLELADSRFYKSADIDMLLGVGVYAEIILYGLKKGPKNMPIAQNTKLGWILSGNISSELCTSSRSFLTVSDSEDAIANHLSKFWDIEELSSEIPKTPDEILCENIFMDSVRLESDGRYMVKLPFKKNISPVFSSNKQIALRRFYNLEAKLDKNIDLKIAYHETIKEYLKMGHMASRLPVSYPNGDSVPQRVEYFLPHHAVVKSSSSTTKVRVVFDASCRTPEGSSLNDYMLIGPKLQNDIFNVIFSWRKYQYAFTADITKMYRQIWVHPSDYKYQQILWRFSRQEPIKEYFLKTVTFGTSAAPYLAIRVMHYIAQTASSNGKYPLAIQACFKEFYVDDLLSGDFTISASIEKQKQIYSLLNEANLTLRKWSSNTQEILNEIPTYLRETETVKTIDSSEFTKTLGTCWHPSKDIFSFVIKSEEFSVNSLTKRKILSLISKLYDPLGWISPVVFYAKYIMQQLWASKTQWDELPESSIINSFHLFLERLPALEQIILPRWIGISSNETKITMYGFCDASEKGYSSVIYIFNEKQNRLQLLASKTRIAPLKTISLARLELCGALLLSHLFEKCKSLLTNNIVFSAFCDSQIVLHWLNSHPSKWKSFVANRTSAILDIVDAKKWFYINTKHNPADIASRGVLPDELIKAEIWWNGPEMEIINKFRVNFKNESKDLTIDCSVEEKRQVFLIVDNVKNIFISKYSSMTKLNRKVEIISIFFINCFQKLILKNSSHKSSYQAKLIKLRCSETTVIRLVQLEAFQKDIYCLQNKQELSKKSKLLSLYPFLDNLGILRVGGRLQNSICSYEQRHPAILPSNHQVTCNLIRSAHEETMHGGLKLTHAYIRNKYHILRVQEKIKKEIRSCVRCARFMKTEQTQLMGSLPSPRVNEFRPFLNSGVDFAGPILLKAWSGRCNRITKGYISIFICLSSKAIHLELVTDLTSESFLAAFKRFISRRGRCQCLYSDCGTNFKGASSILKNDCLAAQRTWKGELQTDFTKLQTEWSFIPPASPHFGGLWEAGVKSVKTHLYKTVGQSKLTYEELSTLLSQIEAILNSRPLCAMSNNCDDYNPLTPAHFLIGEALVAPPEPQINVSNQTRLKRWQYIQRLQQLFWKQWREEYLYRLQSRPKWKSIKRNIKVGDLVLLNDERLPPLHWPLARVIGEFPGQDLLTRVVTVRLASGSTYKRPVSKICLLPVDTN